MNFSGCKGYTKDWGGRRDKKVSKGIYGDIKVLEHLPQLTSVNMSGELDIHSPMKITGECSEEFFSLRVRFS